MRLSAVSLSRPPRATVFFDRDLVADMPCHWSRWVYRVLEACSEVWGGFFFSIMPYNGTDLTQLQWKQLEAYDPDLILFYQFRVRDMSLAIPPRYHRLKSEYEQNLKAEGHDDRFVEESLNNWSNRRFGRSWTPKDKPGLFFLEHHKQQMVRRIAPFHHRSTVDGRDDIIFHHLPLSITREPDQPLVSAPGLVSRHSTAPTISTPSFDSHGSLGLMCASFFGQYNDVQRDRIENLGIATSRLSPQRSAPRNYQTTLRDTIGGDLLGASNTAHNFPIEHSGFGLSAYELPWRNKEGSFEARSKALFVVGGCVEDFTLFHNLSRLVPSVYWMPDSSRETTRLLDRVLGLASSPIEQAYLISESLGEDEAVQLAEDANIVSRRNQALRLEPTPDPAPVSYLDDPFNQLGYRRRYRDNTPVRYHTAHIEDELDRNSIEPPVPETLKVFESGSVRWVTEVVHRGYLAPARGTLVETLQDDRLPYRVESTFNRWSVDGEARLEPARHFRTAGGNLEDEVGPLLLVRPSAEKLFSPLVSPDGRLSISDKGRYQRETVGLFGGLEDTVKWFRRAGFRYLLEDVFKEKDRSDRRPPERRGIYVGNRRRRVLAFPSFQRRFGKRASAVLSTLLQYDVFQRGVALKCDRCGRADWYPVDQFGHTFECTHCSTRHFVSPKHHISSEKRRDEPIWYYRLNEMVAQGWKHDMQAVLFTLDVLRRLGRYLGGFLFVPEQDLVTKSGAFAAEIDILAIVGGEIVVGEVKASATSPSTSQRDSLRRVSELFGADRCIVATTGSWASGTKQAILQDLPDAILWDEDRVMSETRIRGWYQSQ